MAESAEVQTATRRPVDALPLMLVAVAWSWAWWAVAIALGGTETAAGAITYLVGGFGPAIVVVGIMWRSASDYRSDFRRRMFMWRVTPKWWFIALAMAAGPKLVATLLAAIGGHTATGESLSLIAVPLSLLFMTIVVFIEEPLWRGVALDRSGKSLVRASLLIGVVWSLWHAPLFAVEGTWQHGLGFGTVDFFVFSIAVVGLSVILTWLVVASGGSIFLAMAAHLVINMTGEFVPDDTTIRFVEMLLIMGLAGFLLFRLTLLQGSQEVLIRFAPARAGLEDKV